jgi:hypothetical protein
MIRNAMPAASMLTAVLPGRYAPQDIVVLGAGSGRSNHKMLCPWEASTIQHIVICRRSSNDPATGKVMEIKPPENRQRRRKKEIQKN